MASQQPMVKQSGTDGSIEVSFKDDIAIIKLKRGENRINQDLVEQFHTALDEVLEQVFKILIVVIHGLSTCTHVCAAKEPK